MTGTELRQRRAAAGITLDQFAEAMGRHRDEAAGWEAIDGTLPRSLVRELDWALANLEREKAFADAGLPPCEWVQAEGTSPQPTDQKSLKGLIDTLHAHVRECKRCQQREEFAKRLPPLPAMPQALHVRAAMALVGAIQRLPAWLRPAAVGALIVAVMTIFRALVITIARGAPPSWGLLGTVAAAIGVGAYAGAVGGAAYTLVRGPTASLGRLAPYTRGLACAYAYLLAFGVPLALFGHEEMFPTGFGWLALAVVGTLMGILVGHMWFRGPDALDGGA